jgi:hypothetical protein
MTTRQITTITCRCAAAVLAGCLLVAGCGSAGAGASPDATSAGPTIPLVTGRVSTYFPSTPI